MITSLAESFRSLRGGKKGLSNQGLLKGFWSKGKRRWEGNWDFADVRKVVNTPSLPPFRGSRDPCKVEGLHLYLFAVILAYLG